ncbi:MAG: hypothetical protein ACNYZG_10915 [Gammaproteobacteria bacterium]
MTASKVDFRATTATVLDDFGHGFADMVVQLLKQHNTAITTADGKEEGTYVDISTGNGLLVMAHYGDDKKPFTMTTEFLVPSNELAASFMVMWRRWCNKRGISSNHGLLSLINRVVRIQQHIAQGNQYLNTNLAIGLMGAVLDNYPEIVSSMRWSVDNGIAPCLVIANDNNLARCGVCYGGRYMAPEMASQVTGTKVF